jgi:hypothetical protein
MVKSVLKTEISSMELKKWKHITTSDALHATGQPYDFVLLRYFICQPAPCQTTGMELNVQRHKETK